MVKLTFSRLDSIVFQYFFKQLKLSKEDIQLPKLYNMFQLLKSQKEVTSTVLATSQNEEINFS